MSDPDTKKGAVPFDQRSEPGQGEQASDKANGKAGEPGQGDPANDVNTIMKQMLQYLYNEAVAGRVKALSCVFVDGSDVPQHAFAVAPGAAVPLLAGTVCSVDAIKDGALKSMSQYRQFLIDKAKHEASLRSEPSAASAESASKPLN